MEEIDIEQIHEPKTSDKLREIATGITPGKGIAITEAAAEIGIAATNLRTHAMKLGCYIVITTNGKPRGFITHLPA